MGRQEHQWHRGQQSEQERRTQIHPCPVAAPTCLHDGEQTEDRRDDDEGGAAVGDPADGSKRPDAQLTDLAHVVIVRLPGHRGVPHARDGRSARQRDDTARTGP